MNEGAVKPESARVRVYVAKIKCEWCKKKKQYRAEAATSEEAQAAVHAVHAKVVGKWGHSLIGTMFIRQTTRKAPIKLEGA